jgi:dihydrofolate synthase/folylpolyglutamate synthase
MTYAEAVQFLYDLRMFGAKFGLDNTRRLAALAGNPHERLRFIHVAGTNGKGSTCAMLESIYRAAGLRVGLFTSPHLVSFTERIQVNRQHIPELEVVRLVAELREQSRAGVPPAPSPASAVRDDKVTGRRDACPTFFEFVTVMALRYFAEQHCDLVIWETGLGGRLDATNIVTPLASVITNIGFDHQHWLGDTLDKIAAEKAGIIKPGLPVLTAAEPGHGLEVIATTAQQQDSLLTVIDRNDAQGALLDAVKLPLAGNHQRLNAALAVATVRAVAPQIHVTQEAMLSGLSLVQWPGRMQVVQIPSGQTLLLDGAHNEASANALAESFRQLFPAVRPVLILGVLEDKDWKSIARTLAPLAARLLLVPVNSARSLAPDRFLSVCKEANPTALIEVCPSLAEALRQSAGEPFVVITGSLYLVGEATEHLGLSPAPPNDERGLNEWVVRK